MTAKKWSGVALAALLVILPISAQCAPHTVTGLSSLHPYRLKTVSPVAYTSDRFGTLGAGYRGEYIVQNNEWNSSAPQILTTYGSTRWGVATNQNVPLNGSPAAYPSIYKGCHWGACTRGSGLPIQASKLAAVRSSWSTQQPPEGAYDVAYDIWFNSTPATSGQPDGTELMIWVNSRGGVQPFGSPAGSVPGYQVWHGTAPWQVVTYQATQGTASVTNLDVLSFVKDAEARGYINPNHYLVTAEAGFEIWLGGSGLTTNSFSFTVS